MNRPRPTPRAREPGSLHVVASIDDPAAGPSYSVAGLARGLAQLASPTRLLSVTGWRSVGPAAAALPGVDHAVFPWDFGSVPVLSRLCLSRGLRGDAVRCAGEADIVHTHGLWLMPNVYAASAAKAARRPFVISPRGMLGKEALAFSILKKRAFWIAFQKRAMDRAVSFHATSEQEHDDIRAFGVTKPVVVIPNGIEIPVVADGGVSDSGQRFVLSLGRLHPKKGLDRLLRAWSSVEREYPDWILRIVGPDEGGYARELRALARDLGLVRTTVEEPAFGGEKVALMRAADLFVLPSLNENFAMTVAESLSVGTPVISSKGAPWSGLETERCGWWVEHGVEPLSEVLRAAMAMPRSTLKAMGERGRAWMARDYSWESVASRMLRVYRWLSCDGDPGPDVRFT